MSMDRNSRINDDETLKPERKKLRSCEPDLKITVGGGGENENPVDYWCHASVMATHSKYVDAILANGMKESTAREISFPDIAPATWESMMIFLEQPLAGRLMKATDVMEVAPFYDQYDFPAGRELCGHVLSEYFKAMIEIITPDDIDFIVDAVLLADAVHLEEAKKAGVKWIMATMKASRFVSGRSIMTRCPTIFTRDHITRLVPLIIKENYLFKIAKKVAHGGVETKDDILSRLFPHLLVQQFSLDRANSMLQVPAIALSGSESAADGAFSNRRSYKSTDDRTGFKYVSNRTAFWGETVVTFNITAARDSCWVIRGDTLPARDEDGVVNYDAVVEKILWKCPHSHNLAIPPKVGWIPVDDLAASNPKLSY